MKLSSLILAWMSQSRLLQEGRDFKLRLNLPDYFSQYGEDVFIFNTILGGHTEQGTYVDIGASHPTRLSNTYYFYRKGWRGIVVEPISSLIKQHRRWRPEDVHVQCLIGDSDGEAEFYQVYPSVLSTTSRNELETLLRNGSVLMSADRLPQIRLETLIDRHLLGDTIDLMSVDVEGVDDMIAHQIAELPVALQPKILCIEANDLETANRLGRILSSIYSNLHHIECNLIFWNER